MKPPNDLPPPCQSQGITTDSEPRQQNRQQCTLVPARLPGVSRGQHRGQQCMLQEGLGMSHKRGNRVRQLCMQQWRPQGWGEAQQKVRVGQGATGAPHDQLPAPQGLCLPQTHWDWTLKTSWEGTLGRRAVKCHAAKIKEKKAHTDFLGKNL